MRKINNEKAKELIKQAVEHLSEAELLEANGWSSEDIETLEIILNNDFDIHFK